MLGSKAGVPSEQGAEHRCRGAGTAGAEAAELTFLGGHPPALRRRLFYLLSKEKKLEGKLLPVVGV